MMAQDIRTRLILDNSQFQRGMEQSQRQTRGFGQSMMGLVRTVKVATAAVAALSAGITAMARRTADSAAQIRDLSRSIGVGARAIQQFRFAAQQNSVDIASADRALEQFTRRMGEAARGTGEARSALAEMGISLRDNNGQLRDSQDILRDVADAFQRTNDATRNADRANRLFGRSGIELISVLRGGSQSLQQFANQADRLGALTDAEVQTLGKLSDSYTTLGAAIRGVVNQFVLGLEPALRETNEQLTQMLENNQDLARTMGEGVGEALRRLGDVAVLVANSIDLVRNALLASITLGAARSIQSIASKFSSASSRAKSAGAAIGGINKSATRMLGVFTKTVRTLFLFGTKLGLITAALYALDRATIQINETTTTFSEILSAVIWKIRELVSRLPSFSQVMDDVTEGFRLSGRIVRQWINFIINSFNLLPEVALIAFRQLERVIKGEGLPALEEYREAIDRVFAQDHVGAMAQRVSGPLQFLLGPLGRLVDQYRAAQKDLDRQGPLRIEIQDGVAEELPEMLSGWRLALSEFFEGFREGFSEFQNSLQTNTQLGAEVFKRFTDGMTDALTRFFTTGRLSFRNFLADIATMIIRSNVQRALSTILGGFSFFGGGTAAPEMGAFGRGIHNLLASPFGKALGGMIPAGKVGLVGERGPEFIKGPAQITPIRQGDMQQQPTQVNYYIEAIDTASFEERLARNPEFLFGVTQRGARGFAT